jgi:hypothetical protein
VNAPSRARGNACGFTACSHPPLDGRQWCSAHISFALSNGIPIDVYTDPTHWRAVTSGGATRTPAGKVARHLEDAPVNLADWGDHCGQCHRLLIANEPIFRGSAGKIVCAACNDAHGVEPAPLPPAPDLVTSVLMRRASLLLDRFNPPYGIEEMRLIAHELRARAAALALIADDGAAGAYVEDPACRALLRAIGEVRS